MTKKIRSSSVILLFVLTLFIVYECSMMFAGVDDMAENITAFGTISTFPILFAYSAQRVPSVAECIRYRASAQ